ncbi:MAG: NUDIX hydrolase [Acidimicrobiales bacterium]
MTDRVDLGQEDQPDHEWEVLGRRTVHASWWLELHLDRVRLNDGRIIEHEVVVSPRDASGAVVVDGDRVLMIYRHRFITGAWGWELPAGVVDPGETPEEAAARECVEESGFRPGTLRHLTTWHPSSGFTDQTFHVYLATSATEVGPPTETNEAIRVEWRTFDQIRNDHRCGRIPDGFTQVGLAWAAARLGRSDILFDPDVA